MPNRRSVALFVLGLVALAASAFANPPGHAVLDWVEGLVQRVEPEFRDLSLFDFLRWASTCRLHVPGSVDLRDFQVGDFVLALVDRSRGIVLSLRKLPPPVKDERYWEAVRRLQAEGVLGPSELGGSGALAPAAQLSYLIEQKNRVAIPSRYEPLTFGEFLALPSLPAEYTASDWGLVLAHTGRSVSLEGYIAEVIPAMDGATYGRPPEEGGVHLHLRETRQPGCFPGGPRGRQLVAEVTPHFHPPKTRWAYDALLDLCQRQVRVRLLGWLLHDYQHVQDVGVWRASAWEIHPVTKIEIWDPERQSWQPLP
ncbi:MAG: hypothetical protein ACK4Z6_02330 [Candidatus Methylomirabilales bacterium]